MKLSLLCLSFLMVGCLKPVPPPPEVPQVIVVTDIPATQVPVLVIVEAGVSEPLVKTWLTGEELIKFKKEEARAHGECVCDDGDPLCDCEP